MEQHPLDNGSKNRPTRLSIRYQILLFTSKKDSHGETVIIIIIMKLQTFCLFVKLIKKHERIPNFIEVNYFNIYHTKSVDKHLL